MAVSPPQISLLNHVKEAIDAPKYSVCVIKSEPEIIKIWHSKLLAMLSLHKDCPGHIDLKLLHTYIFVFMAHKKKDLPVESIYHMGSCDNHIKKAQETFQNDNQCSCEP